MRSFVKAALPLALTFLLAAPAAAQSFWLDHDRNEVSLEILRPTLDGGDLSFFSFTAFATLATRVGERSLLVVELPYSRARPDIDGADASSTVGNPYVGLQTLPESETGWRASVGVRIPLVSNDAGLAQTTGLLSSVSDRFEAFVPDLIGVSGQGRYVGRAGETVFLSGRFGGIGDFSTQGGVDPEFFLTYGGKGWVEADALAAGVGFSGRWLLSESDLAFRDRTFHELGLWAEYDFGGVRPGIRVQVPVGRNVSDVVDQVIGLYVRYAFP